MTKVSLCRLYVVESVGARGARVEALHKQELGISRLHVKGPNNQLSLKNNKNNDLTFSKFLKHARSVFKNCKRR
jgi:hypothetical protein